MPLLVPRRPRPASTRLAVLLLLLLFALPALAAPDWTLEDPAGRRVSFADELAQGPVVVSFWATWCKPCLKELPQLEILAGRYQGRVAFLAVSTDDSRSIAKVEPTVRAHGWENLVVLLDTGGDVQRQLHVDAMPFLILYDREGREAYRQTGYVMGSEADLELAIEKVLGPEGPLAADVSAPVVAGMAPMACAPPPTTGDLTATDRFEYSYATETRREIVENWLDLSLQRGNVRAGLTLDSQSPGEEGGRRNEITHRWFELTRGDMALRVGTFHGLFGRGLLFNAWQDRNLRIDTRLDGLIATARHGGLAATAFSGTPSARELDLRGADLEWTSGAGLAGGFSGLTWANQAEVGTGAVDREWAASLRARQSLGHADWYVEVAGRNRFSLDAFDFDPATDDPRRGWALYGNLNLYQGPVTLSWEASDYEDFELVSRADGATSLNRPPSLAGEFTWTLLNRAPHTLNATDEKGHNLDLTWSGPSGVTAKGSASRLRRHDGGTVYEMAYVSVEKEQWGDFAVNGALGFQDSEGLRQTVAVEVTWHPATGPGWILQAEQQHVRMGGGVGFDLGAYDQQWLKLECATTSNWTLGAVLETNNKYDEQRSPGEDPGPYLAAQATRRLDGGATLNLWAGERQAGFLCSGGVCKYEPAFAGIEFYGTLRW
jgi:cytochrome c biogenesis protein CcmG/thiol:disulfide interchange protein DsbE